MAHPPRTLLLSALLLGCLLALGACGSDRLIPLGYDLPDAGPAPDAAAPGDAGRDGGAPDAGKDGGPSTDDAGSDAGPKDAGWVDGRPALEACARLDACVLGADYGTGLRQELFAHCVAVLVQPPAAGESLADGTVGPWLLEGWTLPAPLWLSRPSVRSCLLSAQDCGGVLACFNGGAPVGPCTPSGGGASCSGSRLEVCTAPSAALRALSGPSANTTFSFDCAARGMQCQVGSASSPRSFGCAKAACDRSQFQTHCAGTVAVRCSGGLLDEWDCGAENRCAVVDAGSGNLEARCVGGDGGTCNASTDLPRCAGGRLSQCVQGRWLEGACGPGTTCQVGPSGRAFCGVASDCVPAEEPPRCGADGGSLEVCLLGARQHLSCAQLGFLACVPAAAYRASAYCR